MERELFESGEVQSMESWPFNLGDTAQCSRSGQRYATGRLVRCRNAPGSQHAGLRKRLRVEELGDVVRSGIRILPCDFQRLATDSSRYTGGTADPNGLSALKRRRPDNAPASQ